MPDTHPDIPDAGNSAPDNAGKNSRILQQTGFIIFLTGIIFTVYASNLHGPLIFDDSRIQTNPSVQITDLSLENLLKAGFESSPKTRPVSYISFAVNYFFHGFNTTGYHIVNIVIHALAAIFLYLFLQATLDLPLLRPRYGRFTLLPITAALAWAVHPVQTQSVTYIIQRMNSLAAMFYILSFYLYVRGRVAQGNIGKWLLLAGCTVSGLLALGSKETAATLPLFIFLYEWYFFRDLDRNWLKSRIIPMLLMLACIALLSLAYLGFAPLEHIASSYSARNFTPYQRLLTEFRVVLFYVSLLLFPLPARLNLDHHFTISTGFFSPVSTLISAVLLLLLLITAFTAARKQRLISFSILWFIGNLVIESSVIGLEIIFEHRMYLPSMLFGLPVLILLYSLPLRQWAKGVLFLIIITLFGFWTFERNLAWNSRIELWGDSAAKSPAKARPHNNLGVALKDEGKLVEAAAHFKKTLALDPEFTEAYNNLGNVYIQLGKFGEATKSYRQALQISPHNAKVHMNLGNVLVKQWELEKALLHYGEALRLAPNDREAQLNFLSTRRMIESRALKKRRR